MQSGVSVAPVAVAPAPVMMSSPPTLIQQSTLYPRAIRLAYGPVTSRGQIIASTNGVIFRSVDDGVTFSLLSKVGARAGETEFCCATPYELPQAVGVLPAGTLLSSASYVVSGQFAMQVYASLDAGLTWNYSSTVLTAGVYVGGGATNQGLYEPEFTVAADGALVVVWSDETDPCCSQKLAQARSYDGTTWRDQTNTVVGSVFADRPGMAVIHKLPDGVYFMSFELCGPAACTVYQKTSPDGWNWTPGSVGTAVLSTTQQHFEHAPFSVWTKSAGSPVNGELVLVGQVLHDAGTRVPDARNGLVVFTNTAKDGTGLWTSSVPAPVPVPSAYDNYCPNYSSALLPSVDGTRLLELASYYDAGGVCRTYAGTGPLE